MNAKVALDPLEVEDVVAALTLAEDWLIRARDDTLDDLADFLAPRRPGVLVEALTEAGVLLRARLDQAASEGSG